MGGGGCIWIIASALVPFLRFSMRFEFLSEMFDHSVCETRDPSLTIVLFHFSMLMVDAGSRTVWRSILFASSSPEYTDNGIMSFVCNAESVINLLGGFMRIVEANPNTIIVVYADLGFMYGKL